MSDYEIGDKVTVVYEFEDRLESVTGIIAGFHTQIKGNNVGVPGFWLKWLNPITDSIYFTWWPIASIVKEISPKCKKCGGPVRVPNQSGRSWCANCEDYQIPDESDSAPKTGWPTYEAGL